MDPRPKCALTQSSPPPGGDHIRAVAGVDEVPAVAAENPVDLGGRLAGGLVVGPQHVAPRTGVQRVVAVAAEELVVARARRHDDARVGANEAPMAGAALVDRVA